MRGAGIRLPKRPRWQSDVTDAVLVESRSYRSVAGGDGQSPIVEPGSIWAGSVVTATSITSGVSSRTLASALVGTLAPFGYARSEIDAGSRQASS